MKIIEDDLTSSATRALLEIHFAGMQSSSPPGTCHFLDFEGLKAPNVTFWSAWDGDNIAGCGLKVFKARTSKPNLKTPSAAGGRDVRDPKDRTSPETIDLRADRASVDWKWLSYRLDSR